MGKYQVIDSTGNILQEEIKNFATAKARARKNGGKVFCNDELIFNSEKDFYQVKFLMNVRKNPSLNAEILGYLKAGEKIEVLEIKNDWLKILYKNTPAYVFFDGGKNAVKLTSQDSPPTIA